MEERFPVSGGWLTCRQTGDRAELTMELPGDSRGLYRGYALGPGGLVELGTLLPEGDACGWGGASRWRSSSGGGVGRSPGDGSR